MKDPVKTIRYGKEVWENTAIDKYRIDHSMCYHCGRLSIAHKEHNCEIAQALYNICKDHSVAFLTTRCAEWEPLEEK